MTVEISVVPLPHAAGLPLPAYETAGAAGMDLLAALEQDMVLVPGERAAVPTGLSIALPAGYEAQVRGRSGLALRHGIGVVNAPGTIDSDYRGEIKVLLINWGDQPVTLTRGMRIAQLVVAPMTQAGWRVVETLPETARGSGGFGSTGA